MADEQRLIYKVELDESGYIRATDSMTASTSKLTDAQERANQTLQTNQTALRGVSANVQQTKRDLDAYTGTNERYRQQLQKSYNDAVKQEQDLTALVGKNQLAYENATKAAQDFADTSAKAANVQQQAGGGKIAPVSVAPIAPVAPPTLPPQFDFLKQFPQLAGLPDLLSQTTDEFEQLRIAIAAAEQVLAGLNQESEEFKQLAPIVDQGKKVLQEYDNSVKATAGSHNTLRTQLRNNREELVKLEGEGKTATDRYRQLELETAKLTDRFNDQQQRIRILASDTKLLDFGKAAITAATSAFQGFTSVQLLFGSASEETQKKVVQLFAAMQLLQSIETLSNLTRREGILSTLGLTAATEAYDAVVKSTAGSLSKFKLALIGSGIGAAVVAIGFLVAKYIEYRNALAEANEQQKQIQDINNKAIDSYAKQVASLTLLKTQLTDLALTEQRRIELATEYNKTADAGNKINLEQINNTDLLSAAIDRQIKKIEQRALAEAAANVTAEKANVFFKARAKLISDFPALDFSTEQIEHFQEQLRQGTLDLTQFTKEQHEQFIAAVVSGDIVALVNAKRQFDQAVKAAAGFTISDTVVTGIQKQMQDQIKALDDKIAQAVDKTLIPGLVKQRDKLQEEYNKLFNPKTPKERTIENAFVQERDKLLADLAALRTKEADSIQAINDQFAAKLTVEQNRIAQLLKDKKIKPTEEKQLIELAVQVNTAELNKALQDFNKKVTDERQKLNDELRKLQEKANQDTLNLIQDEFEKRKALIDANEAKELADQRNATDERLRSLDLERLLIGEEEYQKARQIIIATGEQEVNAIIARAAQQRQDLSADIFKKSLEAYQTAVSDIGLIEDKRQADEVQKESDRFLRGEINYETFQKHLDEINKKHTAQRDQQDIDVLTREIEAINTRIATLGVKKTTTPKPGEKTTVFADTSKEVDDLIKKIKELEAELARLKRQQAEAAAKTKEDIAAEKVATIDKYQQAIGNLIASTIDFWQTANEAEQRALDRSIAIQQTRVDQAQKIAERGNAQYLASETDRLKQLQVARENAARRQLGIDAALQASQILVGITGAIAKISTGIGVAETIAEIAVIVGALATGYGLVRSLQGNQPRLKEGTPYLQREGHPRGTDTIPALLTEGEAVIPRERNEAYHPTVKAIYDQKIPAKVINEFVKNYTKKTVVNNVVNETSDKKIEDRIVNEVVNNKAKTINEKITDIVSKFSKQDKSEISKLLSSIKSEQTSKIVSTLVKNKIISKEDKKSVSNQLNNTVASHKHYQFAEVVSNIVNRTIDEQSKTKFIQEFGVKKYSQIVSSIATHSEAVNKIINQRLNNIVSDSIISNVSGSDIKRYSEVIDRTINERGYMPKTRPIEAPMSPAYERIKEAAEMKITHDATLALSLTEQNKLIEENNELQRMTLKAMKNLSVSAKMDREGIAIAVHEHVEQMIKNKRV